MSPPGLDLVAVEKAGEEGFNWHKSGGAWGGGELPESIWKAAVEDKKDFYIFC